MANYCQMPFYEVFLDLGKDGRFHKNGSVFRFSDEVKLDFLKTVPFIYIPDNNGMEKLETWSEKPLDLPFEICFFEVLNTAICEIQDGGERIDLVGLWIKELAPKKYELVCLLRDRSKPTYSFSLYYPEQKEMQDHFFQIIEEYLKKIATLEVGFNNPRKIVKMGKINNQKTIHRINKIIYITSKKNKDKAEANSTREINWSYQWSVRGHWRELGENRVGKNREGEIITSGFTWVKSHVKGPDGAILVTKTRIVK